MGDADELGMCPACCRNLDARDHAEDCYLLTRQLRARAEAAEAALEALVGALPGCDARGDDCLGPATLCSHSKGDQICDACAGEWETTVDIHDGAPAIRAAVALLKHRRDG